MEDSKFMRQLLESIDNKQSSTIKEDNNDVNAAVEAAKSYVVNDGMKFQLASQAAAKEYNTDFDSVYKGLQQDMERKNTSNDDENISAAVEKAKDHIKSGDKTFEMAAQSASNEFKVSYEDVVKALRNDMNVPS